MELNKDKQFDIIYFEYSTAVDISGKNQPLKFRILVPLPSGTKNTDDYVYHRFQKGTR